MVVSRWSCFQSRRLKTVILSSVVQTVSRQSQQLKWCLVHHRRMSQMQTSSLNLSSKNVIYSRHEDCYLHNQTVVQRFFERASLWPNLVALVNRLIMNIR